MSAAAEIQARQVARPRADALRNRERIVCAARGMFAELGPDVPLDDIARTAGVGNATLYRHFPDRAALIHAVVVSVLDRVHEQVRRAATEESDPFAAVRRFVHAAADERIGALCPMITGDFDRNHPDLLAGRDRLEDAVRELIERAQSAGRMRRDVAVGDLLVALGQLARPLPGTGCTELDRFVHRHLQLFLDGLEAPARSELTGRAITLEDLRGPGAY
ncbi:TetR/AcrR family transcriptional regulator [Streptomyces albipurpureus]|uniref:TetR/AcrR family transcriptional regulator n=1 Tax=Streptomyces albipurpureus TaxID=2897419 RepID=A0ABT0UXT9_9ACTN|nr:TetR/AcrR family transcriptional regulator [Streptomyces sp. CWNU-1]MCM2393382.1 TetR/AcrR family transcriptional regulator [Streptomyces sp. CWNU-1]